MEALICSDYSRLCRFLFQRSTYYPFLKQSQPFRMFCPHKSDNENGPISIDLDMGSSV